MDELSKREGPEWTALARAQVDDPDDPRAAEALDELDELEAGEPGSIEALESYLFDLASEAKDAGWYCLSAWIASRQAELDLDERSIDAYIVEKLAQPSKKGGTIKPQTVNKHLKLLGRTLRIAQKWKLVGATPEISMLKERKPKFDFLDFEEANAFMAAAAEREPEWHPFVVIAARTGLRIGELVALRWNEDVDLERRRVTVQRSYCKKHGFQSTKNDKIRELPLTWDATEALRVPRSRVDGDLVFDDAEGGVLQGWKSNEALARIAESIGMRRITNHQLRHTFASHAVMRGISIRQVQEWMGHGSVVVTMKYAHLAEGHGDELIQRLCPDPSNGSKPRSGAARAQHNSSTQTGPKSKSASYRGSKG